MVTRSLSSQSGSTLRRKGEHVVLTITSMLKVKLSKQNIFRSSHVHDEIVEGEEGEEGLESSRFLSSYLHQNFLKRMAQVIWMNARRIRCNLFTFARSIMQ